MKKLNLTDKRKPDYFYSEAIKTLAYKYPAVRSEHKGNSGYKLFSE